MADIQLDEELSQNTKQKQQQQTGKKRGNQLLAKRQNEVEGNSIEQDLDELLNRYH